jgi:hypothetical protein
MDYKCRQCGQGGFTSAGSVARHRKEAGHPKIEKSRTGGGRNDSPRAARAKRSGQGEGAVLNTCVDAFENGNLSDDGRRRVLVYLNDRFLPDEPVAETASE